MVLLPLLGITWTFGLLAVNDELIVFQYLFAIFNSLQVGEVFYVSLSKTQYSQGILRWRTFLSYNAALV